MCTVTLTYDQNNALARRKLVALLATGLFHETENVTETTKSQTVTEEEYKKEVDAFLYASKHNMSPIIARYL